jgi:hypothetical protein
MCAYLNNHYKTKKMKPQEKAENLVNEFLQVGAQTIYNEQGSYKKTALTYPEAQVCALIAVEEIIAVLYKDYYDINNGIFDYWQTVKVKIETL